MTELTPVTETQTPTILDTFEKQSIDYQNKTLNDMRLSLRKIASRLGWILLIILAGIALSILGALLR